MRKGTKVQARSALSLDPLLQCWREYAEISRQVFNKPRFLPVNKSHVALGFQGVHSPSENQHFLF